jgi:hypothetical protein
MKGSIPVSLLMLAPGVSVSAAEPVALGELTVYSSRVANQLPAGTFAMPVSTLRYEPSVDIHPRNLAEGQADITIRGGSFENTGFQVGAVTVGDPQTGHYLAELPIAPAMLTAPRLVTGADLAQGPANATSGGVVHGWREVRTAGWVSGGWGDDGLRRGELYQGVARDAGPGRRLGADVAVAHSRSDGAVPFGDHEFDRVSGRFQLTAGAGRTDVFAGYQAKFFGWPNLYTPFNSAEAENLQTVLLGANHRHSLGRDEYLEAGIFHRRNKDDYAFNRFAPVGPVHPFQHTTHLRGAAASLRVAGGGLIWNVRAEASRDRLASTSLTFGRYASRRLLRLALLPEWDGRGRDGGGMAVRAGLGYDDSNRGGGALAPVAEAVRYFARGPIRTWRIGAAESTQLPTYTALNSSPAAGLFRGNPDLGRQTSRNFETGISAAGGAWSGEATAFWRRDEALVDWTFRSGTVARTANAVDLDVGGLELVVRRTGKQVELTFGYTALTKSADYRQPGVEASFYALNYARHRLTLAAVWRPTPELTVRWDNAARIQAANLLRTVGGDRALHSALGVQYRPQAWPRLEFGVHLENLWDEDFQDVPGVPATPRQSSVSFGYTW